MEHRSFRNRKTTINRRLDNPNVHGFIGAAFGLGSVLAPMFTGAVLGGGASLLTGGNVLQGWGKC